MKIDLTEKFYKKIIKPIAFKQDPEKIHKKAIKIGKILGRNEVTKNIISSIYKYKNPILSQTILKIKFENPIGLSAGFDKNAEIPEILEGIGFGFAELGSITAKPCSGNKGIRIKRIPEKQSLWINLGLNNFGTDSIFNSLKSKEIKMPIGISIAKTNCKETADEKVAIKDYLYSIKKFSRLRNIDYLTINISCPNAYGGQPFNNPKLLSPLLKEVSKLKIKKPIFIKMSPNLSKKNINQILKIAEKNKISGLICSNLNKKFKAKSGGLSGLSVQKESNDLLSYIYKKTHLNSKSNYKPILIGVGGIFSAKDAYKKIKLGASLLQLITGMIYEGPQLIGKINHDMAKLLKQDGFNNINEAVGSAHKKSNLKDEQY